MGTPHSRNGWGFIRQDKTMGWRAVEALLRLPNPSPAGGRREHSRQTDALFSAALKVALGRMMALVLAGSAWK